MYISGYTILIISALIASLFKFLYLAFLLKYLIGLKDTSTSPWVCSAHFLSSSMKVL